MIKVQENTSGRVRLYAENEKELINSLFTTQNGSFDKLYKITKKKNAVLYWTSENGGFYQYSPNGLFGKFSVSDGRNFYQYTLDKTTFV